VNRKDVREARGLEVNRLSGMQIFDRQGRFKKSVFALNKEVG
jgi:hypothetical protein